MRCAKQFSITVVEITEVCPNWALIAVVDPKGYIVGDGSSFGGTTAVGGTTGFDTAPLAISGMNCSTAMLRLAWTISGSAPAFNFATAVQVIRNPGLVVIANINSPFGVVGSGSAELQFSVPAFATDVFLRIEAGNVQAFQTTVVTISGSVVNDGVPPP